MKGRQWIALLAPSRRDLSLALACLVLAAATEPALAWMIKTIVSWDTAPAGRLDYRLLPAGVLLIFTVRGLAAAGAARLVGKICGNAVASLQRALFGHLLDSKSGAAAPGSFVHLIVFEVKQCSDLIERVLTRLLRHALTVAGLLAYLCYTDPWLSALIATVLPLSWLVCRVLGRRLERLAQRYIELNEALADTLIEKNDVSPIVRLHGGARRELDLFGAVAADVRRHALRMYTMTAAAAPLTQVLAVAVLSPVLLYLMADVAGGGRSREDAVAYAASMLLLLPPLKNLAELNGPLLRGRAGIRAMLALLNLPGEGLLGQHSEATVHGALRLRGVQFTYPGQTAPALQTLDLDIAAGDFIAVTGATGSGKSTLLRLLSGTLRPDQGQITLDGTQLDRWSLDAVRAAFGVVEQEPVALDRSIAENVAYGADSVDLERVRQALRVAQLLEHVERLPLGLQASPGKDGCRLSGGQRQQLAIARACYRDPAILLLDEITSALDEQTELAICAALKTLRHGRTTVLITHRETSMRFAERRIVLRGAPIPAGPAGQPVQSHP